MIKHKKIILIICLLALYLERELACRNLGCWVNNDNYNLLENLWLFSKPYHLVITTFFLVVRKNILIGIIGLVSSSYQFITMEIWQYNNFDDYQLFTPYDSLEIRTIFKLCVKIIFYSIAYKSYLLTKTN